MPYQPQHRRRSGTEADVSLVALPTLREADYWSGSVGSRFATPPFDPQRPRSSTRRNRAAAQSVQVEFTTAHSRRPTALVQTCYGFGRSPLTLDWSRFVFQRR